MSRIFQAGSVVTNFVANTKNFMDETNGVMGQLRTMREEGGDMNISMKAVGTTIMGAGAAMATGVGTMVGVAANGTDSLKKLAAQTNSTGGEFDLLKEIVRDIKIQGVGEGIEDITSTVGQAKNLFRDFKDEVDDASENAMWYKEIFEVDSTDSLKAAHSMVNNFRSSVDESYDLMTFVRQEAGDKAQDLEDSFWEYSTYFKELGFQQEEMGQVFVNSMKNGNAFNYDKIGDAMKEFKLRFYDMPFTDQLSAEFEEEIIPSFEEFMADKLGSMEINSAQDMVAYQEKKYEIEQDYAELVQQTNQKNKEGYDRAIEANEAVNALRDIGMDPDKFLQQVRGGGKGATNAIKELTTALSQVDDKSMQDKYSTLFFGTQGEDLGRDFMSTFANYGEIDVDNDRLAKAKDIFLDENLLAALRETGALFLDIASSLGGSLIPAITTGVQAFNSFLTVIANFLNENKALSGMIATFLSLLSAVMMVAGAKMALNMSMGMLKSMATGYIGVLKGMFGWTGKVGTMTTGLTGKLAKAGRGFLNLSIWSKLANGAMVVLSTTGKALSTVMRLVAVGIRTVTVAMLTNPVGLIITAVVALIAIIGVVIHKTIGFKKAWEGIKTFFVEILPRAILKMIDIVSYPIKFFTDLLLTPFRMLASLVNIDIPKFSNFSLEDTLMGPKGGGDVTINNNIETKSVDKDNVDSINTQLAEGSRNQALSLGY